MKKNVLLIILIILVMGVLGILTYDKFIKSDTCKCNVKETKQEEKVEIKEKAKEVRYYQFVDEIVTGETVVGKFRNITLNTDGTAVYEFGGNGSGGASYTGTYLENDNTLVLVLKMGDKDFVCNPMESQFECHKTLSFEKQNDAYVLLEEQSTEEGLTEVKLTFNKVTEFKKYPK